MTETEKRMLNHYLIDMKEIADYFEYSIEYEIIANRYIAIAMMKNGYLSLVCKSIAKFNEIYRESIDSDDDDPPNPFIALLKGQQNV